MQTLQNCDVLGRSDTSVAIIPSCTAYFFEVQVKCKTDSFNASPLAAATLMSDQDVPQDHMS